MKHAVRPAAILTAAILSVAFAQNALNLNAAIQQALTKGPDLASSRATLQNAQADLAAKEADPSSLIVTLTQARNTATLSGAQFEAKKLEVAGNVLGSYINLFEAQENIKLQEAQVALDTRNLEVAKARLAAKNGTQLDVSKAENTLSSSRQSLADSRANLPILSNRLEVLLGSNSSGNLTVAPTPAFKEIKYDLAALEKGLENRLPSVMQVSQSVQLSELNVRLADNDYTAPSVLRESKTTFENAKRSLETTRSNAVTQLRDAHRNVQNALERVRISRADLENSESGFEQDQTKFKAGTISKLQLQQSEVSYLRSKYSLVQATNSYWRGLSNLSNAAAADVANLIPGD